MAKDTKQELTIKNNTLKEIAEELINETDVDKVKNLTNLFNLNAQKKNALRVAKVTELLDTVTDRIESRFINNPDNFSNEDLLKYMQAFENSIDKSNKNLKLVEETPPIQLTQNNQVNISVGNTLSRDSKERILDAIKSIMAQNSIDNIVEERTENINDT